MSRLEEVLGTALLKARQSQQGLKQTLPLSALSPSAQPRKRFEGLSELAASIQERGILQPLLVRPAGEDRYEIVAGERRFRAAELAGLGEVPVVVLEVDEITARQIALVENLQREDLNPYEETLAVVELLALELGKSREEVAGLLRRMRDEARGKVSHNVMGGPAAQKVEEVFRDPQLRAELLEEVRQGLSLRDLKGKVRALAASAQAPDPLAWHREAVRRLGRADFQRLPDEKRAKAEELLRQLMQLLD